METLRNHPRRKILLLRRSVFERHFDRLYASWSGGYHPGPEPVLGDPAHAQGLDVSGAGMSGVDAGTALQGRPQRR